MVASLQDELYGSRQGGFSMKWMSWRAIAGLLLVIAGVLLLLQTLNIVSFLWDAIWAVLLIGGGVCFLLAFLGNRSYWWAAIPGMTLLGLGGLVGLSILGLDTFFGGSMFLALTSAGFWLVYLRARENWWAVIPGGVLLTLAAIAGLDEFVPWMETSGLFFLGLALTFALVYLLPTPSGRMSWALIPAGALFLLGLIITLATSSVLNLLGPAVLILGGIYLVYRALRRR
jgi:hypothetical protein